MPDTHADAPLRLVFAHDHRFVRDGDRYLSAGQFNANTWQRYLDICDELVVVAREGKIQSGMQTGDYNVASRPAVSFRFVPDLAGAGAFLLHRQAARRIMHAEVTNADGVIARLPSETGLLAIEVARQQHKPWAVEVVGCAWDALWNYGNLQGKLYAPVMSRRMRQAVARAPFATYVTQSFLQHRYPCETGIVSACSNVDLAPPRTDVLTARLARACETDRKAVVFGLIGTLKGRYKGIQTAIAALAQIRSWHPDCRLRILGSGDPEPWRRLAQGFGIADAVTFDGVLPSGEPVLDWLDEIDVYLQPSLQEGLPRALIEAMSRACPALASNIAGIPELLASDCLHPPGDPHALAALMLRMIDDPAWRDRQSQRNWQTAHRYARDRLQRQRQVFWQQFLRQVQRSKRRPDPVAGTLRVLALTRQSCMGASSRLRTMQYLPGLWDEGISMDVRPLFDRRYLTNLYREGARTKRDVLRCYGKRLLALTRVRHYDLIWIEKELFPYLPSVFERLLRIIGKPYALDLDDAIFHNYDQHRSVLVRKLLGRKIDRIMRDASVVTCGSPYLVARARQAGAARIHLLPTVVDLERYDATPGAPHDRHRDQVVIGWMGSPSTARYLEMIAAPLATLADRLPVRIVAIGCSSEMLAGILPDLPVESTDWSEEHEIRQLAGIDIGIMPVADSPWEQGKCGYKLIQYMAMGKPVVASPVGVNADIVEPGVNGFLARSIDEWIRALETLAGDPALREHMGQAGRRKVELRYNLGVTTPLLAHAMQTAATNRNVS